MSQKNNRNWIDDSDVVVLYHQIVDKVAALFFWRKYILGEDPGSVVQDRVVFGDFKALGESTKVGCAMKFFCFDHAEKNGGPLRCE